MNIVVLTGAGISAESGLETFRGHNGLWGKYRVEEVATHEAFLSNPERVLEFYNELRPQMEKAKPNKAHEALVKLQKSFPNMMLVTQNVDLLHEKAGSENVLHMHGEIDRHICLSCGHYLIGDAHTETVCPHCHQVGTLKPDIVFFGEMPYYIDEIEYALRQADLFIAVGSSGTVYPAAGFVALAKQSGAETILFNLDEVENAPFFDRQILGKASETLPLYVDELIQRHAVKK